MPSEVQNIGAPILFDVRPLFGILGYSSFTHYRVRKPKVKAPATREQNMCEPKTLAAKVTN